MQLPCRSVQIQCNFLADPCRSSADPMQIQCISSADPDLASDPVSEPDSDPDSDPGLDPEICSDIPQNRSALVCTDPLSVVHSVALKRRPGRCLLDNVTSWTERIPYLH